MTENPNTTADLHVLENNRAPNRQTRLQRLREKLQYVIAVATAVVFVIIVVKTIISGSQEDLSKVPALLKQLSNIVATAPIYEKATWQNQTILKQN